MWKEKLLVMFYFINFINIDENKNIVLSTYFKK